MKSIKELCAPISARVMPKSALYAQDHTPLDPSDAVSNQRKAIHSTVNKFKKRKPNDSRNHSN